MTIVMPRITTTAMTTMTTISTTATTTATTMSGRKKFLETELSSSTESKFKFRNEELRWLLQGREQKEREGKNKSQKCDAFSISVSVNALE